MRFRKTYLVFVIVSVIRKGRASVKRGLCCLRRD